MSKKPLGGFWWNAIPWILGIVVGWMILFIVGGAIVCTKNPSDPICHPDSHR